MKVRIYQDYSRINTVCVLFYNNKNGEFEMVNPFTGMTKVVESGGHLSPYDEKDFVLNLTMEEFSNTCTEIGKFIKVHSIANSTIELSDEVKKIIVSIPILRGFITDTVRDMQEELIRSVDRRLSNLDQRITDMWQNIFIMISSLIPKKEEQDEVIGRDEGVQSNSGQEEKEEDCQQESTESTVKEELT